MAAAHATPPPSLPPLPLPPGTTAPEQTSSPRTTPAQDTGPRTASSASRAERHLAASLFRPAPRFRLDLAPIVCATR